MPPSIQAVIRRDGDGPALRDERTVLSWSEVDALLDAVAGRIAATDLGADRRVAVFAENAAETALAYIGGLFGGACVVPVNFHLTAAEAAFILRDSGSRLLLTDGATLPRAREAAASAGVDEVVVWNTDDPGTATPWDTWLADAPAPPPPDTVTPRPNLMYTSGTTGVPKGTDMPPTMFAAGDTVAEHVATMLATHPFAALGPHLVVGPMYHTGPLTSVRLLAGGVPLVVMRRFDPEAVLAAIATHRPGSSQMVPTHFVRLLALPPEVRSAYDVSSLRAVGQTGAACPIEVKRRMIEWWGPVFLEVYGGSEVGVLCSISSPEWLDHPGSVGRPRDQFSALVVDDDGAALPPGREGRLYFRDATGRGIVYRNDPAKTAAAHLEPGVFTLGEVGYVDEDGYVFITDRFSDMVVSGGVNLYPAEAEQVLVEHPQVADVACIGVPDAEMGERLVALVVCTAGDPPEPEAVLAWCRERLSHFKCPREVRFVADLARDPMGKLNKRRLRDRWGEEVSA
jgi:long-chain acyl-CoA synthetase